MRRYKVHLLIKILKKKVKIQLKQPSSNLNLSFTSAFRVWHLHQANCFPINLKFGTLLFIIYFYLRIFIYNTFYVNNLISYHIIFTWFILIYMECRTECVAPLFQAHAAPIFGTRVRELYFTSVYRQYWYLWILHTYV